MNPEQALNILVTVVRRANITLDESDTIKQAIAVLLSMIKPEKSKIEEEI